MRLILLWLLACGPKAAVSGEDAARLDPSIAESSGLVVSARSPGILWTHGDSGTGNVLYAVDAHGAMVSRVVVHGNAMLDWEDLTSDGAGHLWLADSGNNDSDRQNLALYRIPEPDPHATEVSTDGMVRFRYPDQKAFPDPAVRNFDAEAIFWSEGRMYLLSKHRSDHQTTLYRFPAMEGDVVLEKLSSFELGGPDDRTGGKVTAASISPDGQRLAVLTYHEVFLFSRPASGDDWLASPAGSFPLVQAVTAQCEAIAWSGDDLLITNEDGALFRVSHAWKRREAFPGPAR